MTVGAFAKPVAHCYCWRQYIIPFVPGGESDVMADGGYEVVDIPYDKNAAFMKERGQEYLEIAKRMGLLN